VALAEPGGWLADYSFYSSCSDEAVGRPSPRVLGRLQAPELGPSVPDNRHSRVTEACRFVPGQLRCPMNFSARSGPGQVSIAGELSAPRYTAVLRTAATGLYFATIAGACGMLICNMRLNEWAHRWVPDDELRQTPGSLVSVPFAISVQKSHGVV
jgi:hypothetical protein